MDTPYKFTIAYDGHAYVGFQLQPGGVTVQSALEASFKRILGEDVRVVPSGRTDSGVNAIAQVCHAVFCTEKAQERLEKKDFLLRINSILPDDIAITAATKAPGFHARKNARSKTYEYLILQSRVINPFLEDKVWRVALPLDITAMKRAANYLVGRHDFSAFCASDSTAKDKTREIFKILIDKRSPAPFFKLPRESYLRLSFTGGGFLKQMVRNIVGTLVDVGLGKTTPEQIKNILKSKDRRLAGPNAPARGLYLRRVIYD